MLLPPCPSRHLSNSNGPTFFCANPKNINTRPYVSQEVCGNCTVWRDSPFTRFGTFKSAIDISRLNHDDIEIVIAADEGFLTWQNLFSRFRVRLYTRYGIDSFGESVDETVSSSECAPIGSTAAVGTHDRSASEQTAAAFLLHVAAEYERLAPTTLFLSTPQVACDPTILNRLTHFSPKLPFQYLSGTINVEQFETLENNDKVQTTRLWRTILGTDPPEFFVSRKSPTFAISRARIRVLPRAAYQRALQDLNAGDGGYRALIRVLDYIPTDYGQTEGIITAIDAMYFCCFQFLYKSLSLAGSRPIFVYDLGLTFKQRAWCSTRKDVFLRSPPDMDETLAYWLTRWMGPAWLKPVWMNDAPAERLLWLDADCVMLDSQDAAFAAIARGPLLTVDGNPELSRNDPLLYEHLPFKRIFQKPDASVNSGVVGLLKARDRSILDAWTFATVAAATNPHLQQYIRCYDQGALLWALQQCGAAESIHESNEWNFDARRETDLLSTCFRAGRTILEELRRRHPRARLLHWYGNEKLPDLFMRELEKSFIGESDEEPARPFATPARQT